MKPRWHFVVEHRLVSRPTHAHARPIARTRGPELDTVLCATQARVYGIHTRGVMATSRARFREPADHVAQASCLYKRRAFGLYQ